jgi:hypothetical protein
VPDPTRPLLGWPFLVARGRRRGYQALLVPDRLTRADQAAMLAESLSGDDAVGATRVQTVALPGLGDLLCAYRVERLDDASARGPEPLRDQHGRPLEILYGIVVAARGDLRPDAADLDRAREAALATYGRFLAAESTFRTETAPPLELRSTVQPVAPVATRAATPRPAAHVSSGFAPETPPPAPRASRVLREPPAPGGAEPGWGVWALVALLGLALALGAWFVLLRPSSAEVTAVHVDRLHRHLPQCLDPVPVTFRATVRTDGRVRVRYHWEDAERRWRTGERSASFGDAGARELATTVYLALGANRKATGRVSLVVDDPHPAGASAAYSVTCG